MSGYQQQLAAKSEALLAALVAGASEILNTDGSVKTPEEIQDVRAGEGDD